MYYCCVTSANLVVLYGGWSNSSFVRVKHFAWLSSCMNGCKTITMQFVYVLCIASKRGESRETTRGASAGTCREHAQVGSMIDVKGQSTWSAS